MARITYLGPEGTFTEAALLQMTAAGLIPDRGAEALRQVPIESTPAALDAVRNGQSDYACVPIENSIDGSVMPTLDSLAIGSPLQVFAETTLDVAFSIVVKPGRTAADVRTLAAFPVAAAQVRQWIAANLAGAELLPGLLQRRRRPAGRRRPGRRRGDLAAGRRALGAGRPGRRRRRRTQRSHPIRAGRPARTATRPDRSRSHVGGAAHRQHPRRAGGSARRIRHPRHRPDPDRVPADPHRTRHVPVLRRLRRPHRRRSPSPMHSRRCTVVVRTCDTWVPGRRARPHRRRPPPDDAARWLQRLREGKPAQPDTSGGVGR